MPEARLNQRIARDHGGVPRFRHLHSSCRIGFLNVCSMRHSIQVDSSGNLISSGDETLDLLVFLMKIHKLYALALSEVRLDGQGAVKLLHDYTLVYAGAGSHGGIAFLLSPAAATAWRLAGSDYDFTSSGRLLRLSFQLAGGEGVWHLLSVYGPTLQCDHATHEQFWSDVR